MCLQYNFLKTLREKEKLLETSIYSFSHSVFYPLRELYAILIKFENGICNFFEIENLSFGKELNCLRTHENISIG